MGFISVFCSSLRAQEDIVKKGLNFGPLPALAYYADKILYDKVIGNASDEKLHMSTGAGLRIIMNQNFIVAAEYGLPFSKLVDKNNPIYRQDGDGAFYINLGYLF